MTVTAPGFPKNSYVPDGVQDTFAFTFQILDETNLVVQVEDMNGDLSTKILVTDYTVTGIGNKDDTTTDYKSGDIIFELGSIPLATDLQVIITREVPLTQEQVYRENDRFPAKDTERALDKLTMIAQQGAESQSRAVKVSVEVDGFDTILEDPVPSHYLRYDASAGKIVNALGTAGGLNEVEDDETPSLGGDLNTNTFNITGGLELTTGERLTGFSDDTSMAADSSTEGVTQHAAKTYTDNGLSGKLSNVVEDLTPELGGDLSTNTFNVTGGLELTTGARVTGFSDDTTMAGDSSTESVTEHAAKTYTDNGLATKLSSIDEDLSPKLGADLDTNAFNIIGGLELTTGSRVTAILDEDDFISDSNTALVTQQSAKAYMDTGLDLKLNETNPSAIGTFDCDVTLTVDGSASSAGEIRLAEDSDNGTNYVGFKAPAIVTSNTSFVLPDGDGLADQVLATDASANLSFQHKGRAIDFTWVESNSNDSTTSPTMVNSSLTGGITPKSSSNLIRIEANFFARTQTPTATTAARWGEFEVYRSTGVATPIFSSRFGREIATSTTLFRSYQVVSIVGYEIAGDTGLHTYILRFRTGNPNIPVQIRGGAGDQATLFITEYEV